MKLYKNSTLYKKPNHQFLFDMFKAEKADMFWFDGILSRLPLANNRYFVNIESARVKVANLKYIERLVIEGKAFFPDTKKEVAVRILYTFDRETHKIITQELKGK